MVKKHKQLQVVSPPAGTERPAFGERGGAAWLELGDVWARRPGRGWPRVVRTEILSHSETSVSPEDLISALILNMTSVSESGAE